ncbi:uncharacterized protein LDX57_008751 [Aspergillus melleus]|uniref:uncharacterized protein n=1 Tax=Aspergillus melleus TaxID=138277 RepID=UPI001E8E6FEC|nr:uncharacterized protein LDX57_008751 [Aspergillus melleus]KAH8431090.1 hypothetical protein LDX57_008751 [Aspergillus melleus]
MGYEMRGAKLEGSSHFRRFVNTASSIHDYSLSSRDIVLIILDAFADVPCGCGLCESRQGLRVDVLNPHE